MSPQASSQPITLSSILACLLLAVCASASGCHKNSTKVDATSTAPVDTQSAPQPSSPKPSSKAAMRPALFEVKHDVQLDQVRYHNGEEANVCSIVESLGGGVGLCDFQNDGWLDILVPGGGNFTATDQITSLPTQLMAGQPGLIYRDVSQPSRIAPARHYSHGVTIADRDNDGYEDCLITGYAGLQLWDNMGDGTFIDATLTAGLTDQRWSSSAAWADFNSDGALDLYVCHYVDWTFKNHPVCLSEDPNIREICSPGKFEGLDDTLYLSNGEGGFIDASQAWQLNPGGKGLGVVCGDVDGDGRIDVYVANDTVNNFLYINRGDHFEETAQIAGVAVDDQGIPNGSMGTEIADFNGDLKLDLWAANYERESFALYRNEGNGLFLHVSRPLGITAIGGLYVGFGSCFLDADGDGDLDIAIVNGHVIKYPQFATRRQRPLLLINDRPRFYAHLSENQFFQTAAQGRGLASGDLDRDGHLDLVASDLVAAPTILRSLLGPEHRSLSVQLIGTISNRSAIGAAAILECAEGKQLRTINGGGSYLSNNQRILLFEIPENWQPQSLTIRWPSGSQQTVPIGADSPSVLRLQEAPTGAL